MELVVTVHVQPAVIEINSGLFTAEELEFVFLPDAPPEIKDLFYQIFSSEQATDPISERYANFSTLAKYIEDQQAKQAASLATASTEVVSKSVFPPPTN